MNQSENHRTSVGVSESHSAPLPKLPSTENETQLESLTSSTTTTGVTSRSSKNNVPASSNSGKDATLDASSTSLPPLSGSAPVQTVCTVSPPISAAQQQQIMQKQLKQMEHTPYQDLKEQKSLGLTDEDILERFIDYNRNLAQEPKCIRRTGGIQQPLKCSCLSILINPSSASLAHNSNKKQKTSDSSETSAKIGDDVTSHDISEKDNNNASQTCPDIHADTFLESVAQWQVYFGRKSKVEQQIHVIEWMRYVSDGDIRLGKGCFCVPFLRNCNGSIRSNVNNKDKSSSSTTSAGSKRAQSLDDSFAFLMNHRICSSALMRLLGVGRNWWATCRQCVKTNSFPVHGLRGRQSNKQRKFTEEGQEAELIAFMQNLQNEHGIPRSIVTSNSYVNKKEKGDGEGEASDSDTSVNTRTTIICLPSTFTKRECYRKFCRTRGKKVITTRNGATRLEDIPNFFENGETKSCIAWTTFNTYWKKHFSQLQTLTPSEPLPGEPIDSPLTQQGQAGRKEKKVKAGQEKDVGDISLAVSESDPPLTVTV